MIVNTKNSQELQVVDLVHVLNYLLCIYSLAVDPGLADGYTLPFNCNGKMNESVLSDDLHWLGGFSFYHIKMLPGLDQLILTCFHRGCDCSKMTCVNRNLLIIY